jgi:transposase
MRAMKSKHFRPYEPDQSLLMPPNMNDWLPEDHPVFFVRELVGRLDLSAIYGAYADAAKGGYPPCDPRMMTGLILYAYCQGVASSRRIERATHESVPFRVIAADQHPDHDTIAEFRKRHLEALSGLFVQVLDICREAGLAKLGHVALDGTKVRANGSKHKAMSYGRMKKRRDELEAEVAELMAKAGQVDATEDARYGKGVRGDELPEELRFRETRLAKIKEAMAALEAEAKAEADATRAEIAGKEKERREKEERTGKGTPGRKPKEPSDEPAEKAQRNFTDPDSRIMMDGATHSFEQCYNAQAAVDVDSQVIVAADVTQDANDKKQVEPVVEQVRSNTGRAPGKLSADSGYFSEDNVKHLEDEGIDAYVATGRTKHGGQPPPAPRGRIPKTATTKDRMGRKLRTKKGRETYSKRKSSVEPVFGQIKDARGFRRFLLRGLDAVRAEWRLICLTHNLLKLFRSGGLALAG